MVVIRFLQRCPASLTGDGAAGPGGQEACLRLDQGELKSYRSAIDSPSVSRDLLPPHVLDVSLLQPPPGSNEWVAMVRLLLSFLTTHSFESGVLEQGSI